MGRRSERKERMSRKSFMRYALREKLELVDGEEGTVINNEEAEQDGVDSKASEGKVSVDNLDN